MSDKLTREERETIVTICEADGCYHIDTSIQAHIRKFDKLGYSCIEEQRYDDGTVMSKQYKVPKYAISFRSPKKRTLTDEQRAASAERLRKYRAGK